MAAIGNSHLHHKPHSFISVLTSWIIIVSLSGRALSQTTQKTLYFQENVPAPAEIGTLVLPSAPPDLDYEVLQANDVLADLPFNPRYSDIFDFQLNGNVRAKVALDREQKATYSLVVLRSDELVYTVQIIVRDINDNAPRFLEPVQNLRVAESTAVDVQLKLLGSALDPDAEGNSTSRYEIIGDRDDLFRLEVKPVS